VLPRVVTARDAAAAAQRDARAVQQRAVRRRRLALLVSAAAASRTHAARGLLPRLAPDSPSPQLCHTEHAACAPLEQELSS
jgi:hypothetical protein